MKSRAVAALLLTLLPSFAAQWQLALPGYHYRFPRDHFSHPGYETEWWYYTGNLKSTDGHRFGFELTFFRQALQMPERFLTISSPTWRPDQVYLAHLALSDIDGREFFHTERLNRAGPGLAGVDFAQRHVVAAAGDGPQGAAPAAAPASGPTSPAGTQSRARRRSAPRPAPRSPPRPRASCTAANGGDAGRRPPAPRRRGAPPPPPRTYPPQSGRVSRIRARRAARGHRRTTKQFVALTSAGRVPANERRFPFALQPRTAAQNAIFSYLEGKSNS